MLAASLCLILLLQVNSIPGQVYQVTRIPGNGNVQIISPYGSQIQVLGSTEQTRPYPWLWEIMKNLTITSNSTTEDVQVISPWGNGSFQLNTSPTQSNVNTPLRTLLKNWFYRTPAQPSYQVVNLGGRALDNQRYWDEWRPTQVLLPRRRTSTSRRLQQRRILMRNLNSGQAVLVNTQTLRVPFYAEDWKIGTSYSR
ncbi:uncharacterized protein LOC117592493 [Drosophila guanche]|uniref:Uncharacterized protein n=1 Tax=Drosophila guanche TaxID=7266 RepID=A0A3B0JES9_DROGU|nr:uncharacterized protein LOC117592493 [Drosophila guanche]SPP73800.1 Hypothetical predicted protein [Drosophila guanche]